MLWYKNAGHMGGRQDSKPSIGILRIVSNWVLTKIYSAKDVSAQFFESDWVETNVEP